MRYLAQLILIAALAVPGSALAVDDSQRGWLRLKVESTAAAAFTGGSLDTETTIEDNIKLCLGDDCDGWLVWNGSNVSFNGTDINGAGADGGIWRWVPGAQHFDVFNDFRMVDVSTPRMYSNTTGSGIFLHHSTQTANPMLLAANVNAMNVILMDARDVATDLGIASATYPRLIYMSDDATSPLTYGAVGHDQTDLRFEVATGDYVFEDDTGKGAATAVRTNNESLTFAANPGDASKTTTGLIPDGATLLAVTTRTTTAGTNCTSIDIGDGTDVDIFADNAAVTDSQTTTNANATAQWSNPQLAAGEVTVTGDVNCFDLVISVTAHYIDSVAATVD